MTTHSEAVGKALQRLETDRILPRIWDRDHTVWRPDPTEIADRLGWLDVTSTMPSRLPAIEALAAEARDEGVQDVVLLGMGGSSLGAEVLFRSLYSGGGDPGLHVLDTTVPDWIQATRDAIDLERTWFLAASKSGSTIEMATLLDYFWQEAGERGDHFVAITDPGSELGARARAGGFRQVFENPSDIGGRFSTLSLFGLVPAALVGIDSRGLLERAAKAVADCGPSVATADNPAARLGAFMAASAPARDQLTLLTSPGLATYGLWAEQLVAESTGKEGRGILPVAGEPSGPVDDYGPRRLFVALRLAGDDNRLLDEQLAELESLGAPLLTLSLADGYDLGYQLFLWEIATAVAGHLLDVQPFDQPDVQAAKDSSGALLRQFEATGSLPPAQADDGLVAALEDPPAYVALLGYLAPSPELTRALFELRSLLRSRGLPTTFGYGPRYLHSTGQLHKGGPEGGLHVQLIGGSDRSLPIPGRAYGFETLARAQADGDLAALQDRGRRCLRLDLGPRPAMRLGEILSDLTG